ncbi:DUF2510 domain-containing protein [Leifsonia sp. LS-T14]|uniref:DUF2510 domain-containing protein n=1 Tax=unclassified Leifsonia TaxID=2663824 RepID=UPI0035A5F249
MSSTPANWYDDGSGRLRWWDGEAWTEHFADPINSSQAVAISHRHTARAQKAIAKNAKAAAAIVISNAFADGTLDAVALDTETVESFKAWWWAYQRLNTAADHASAARVEDEEKSIRDARMGARTEGDRTLRKAVEARILRLEQEGRLRIGATHIGTVEAEGALSRSGRKVPNVPGQTEKWVQVLSDRVITPSGAHVIDAYTSAQVYLDGQSQIIQRPTLTRMAVLAPLPGSALIPGLALQKKEKIDSRQGEFQVGGRGWAARVLVHPDRLSIPRQLAEQVNRAANVAADAIESANRQSRERALPPAAGSDLNAELAKLAALKEQALLTDEEFTAAKRQLLGL